MSLRYATGTGKLHFKEENMNGMGTPKDIIIMLLLIVGVIAMTAFISAMKIGERMDKSIAAISRKVKTDEDPQTMKYTIAAALTIAAGAALIIILKQFDVITDTFFPYMKSN